MQVALWNVSKCAFHFSSVINTTARCVCVRFLSTYKTSHRQSIMSTVSTPPILHAFDEFRHYDTADYNFHVGAPHPDELMQLSRVIQQTVQDIRAVPSEVQSSYFQYGATKGSDSVLQHLAAFLTQEYRAPVNWQNLMMTAGASHALGLVCNVFFGDHDGVVFLEDPTYFLAAEIFRGFGLKVIPIPKLDNEQYDFPLWKRRLDEGLHGIRADGHFRGLIYIIPLHSNPRGRCLSPEEAAALARFAADENLVIHCDDVYNSLSYTGSIPPRLFPVGSHPNVISAGTFSKILGPGLRVGWLESTKENIDRIALNGIIESGGCANQFGASLIDRMFLNGLLQTYVKNTRNLYKEKMRLAVSILSEHLPNNVIWHKPQGGYFIWLTFPEDYEEFLTNVLVPEAKRRNVHFQLGSRSCASRFCNGLRSTDDAYTCTSGCQNSIRLSIGHLGLSQLPEGLKILCDIIKKR
ncbi:2-aminoadipate transaminase-like [Paramacrobiotus metropolitanus]|uniref:2-aminoadipate transaminase-like n=1 Tax=Paramacrobiotus metropolitanus TaxID=2943436 RepID=UPI00244659D7|nr:2-aminoadipate transaminase-like [Paramacrobiotus metropolitanus]